ncbi:hypothetical protein LFM09_04250 [Lentzea alba]|uniref:hypothetical protein n=1 Tax=Lentzea alba TaxID=2714351 RepID=UPI0039BF9D23
MRREQVFIGALLTAGGLAVVAAASLPSLLPVWRAGAVDAVRMIGENLGAYQVSSVLFAVGAALTLAGLGALTRLLGGPVAVTGLVLMSVATALWLGNLAFRLTVTVQMAREGGVVPSWYVAMNAWTVGLLAVAAVLAGLALLCYGVAVLNVWPRWAGFVALVFGAGVLGLFLATLNVPPILLYLAPLALGIAALTRKPELG